MPPYYRPLAVLKSSICVLRGVSILYWWWNGLVHGARKSNLINKYVWDCFFMLFIGLSIFDCAQVYLSCWSHVLYNMYCIITCIVNFSDINNDFFQVPNYIPSISTSIGDFTPQKYIWRICIALHCFPRLLIALLYYNYYRIKSDNPLSTKFRFLNGINSLLTIVENFALLVITYVSSRENFGKF